MDRNRSEEKTPRARRWLGLTAGALLVAAGTSTPAAASECDAAALCSADPCRIEREVVVGDGCVLDFGNRNVVIAPKGRISSNEPYSTVRLTAGSLLVQGEIDLVGAMLEIEVSGAFTTRRGNGGPGRVRSRVHATRDPVPPQRRLFADSGISIQAGGPVQLGGADITSRGGAGYLTIEGSEIHVDSRLSSEQLADHEHNWIFLTATAGPVTTTRLIRSRGRGHASSGGVVIAATGNVTVGAPIDVDDSNLSISSTGGNVRVNAAVEANSWDHLSSAVEIDAAGDIDIDGEIEARGLGHHAFAGGTLQLVPGPRGNVRIRRRVDLRGPSSSGGLHVPDACSIAIAGEVLVNSGDGNGEIDLTYRDTLDLRGATLRGAGRPDRHHDPQHSIGLADPTIGREACGCLDTDADKVCDPGSRHVTGFQGLNHFTCRCADSDGDGECDAGWGCASPPLGVDSFTVLPSAHLHPARLASCR